jgi:hypothetical protein
LKSNNLAKVIFEHELEHSVCIQYHPKGIKGGVMPELDSHTLSESVPDGVKERVAPWHACGPPSGWERYGEVMRMYEHLWLVGVKVQLAEGESDVEEAARQWENLFGVRKVGRGEVGFTNAKMVFLEGIEGEEEGIKEIVIGVEGQGRLEGILRRARSEGLEVIPEVGGGAGTFKMLGVGWKVVLKDGNPVRSQL